MKDKEDENTLDDEMFNTWRDRVREKENILKEADKPIIVKKVKVLPIYWDPDMKEIDQQLNKE